MIFVKLTSLIVSSDSMKERPVSDAPTTTMRELLLTLTVESYFFVSIAREKGACS